MRSWYADWVERSSIRAVSMGVGLGRTTLHKFVAGGTNPHPRVRRLLALGYLRGQSGGADEEAAQAPLARDEDSPGAALAILVDDYPETEQENVRRCLLDVLREAHGRAGREPPAWLSEE